MGWSEGQIVDEPASLKTLACNFIYDYSTFSTIYHIVHDQYKMYGK